MLFCVFRVSNRLYFGGEDFVFIWTAFSKAVVEGDVFVADFNCPNYLLTNNIRPGLGGWVLRQTVNEFKHFKLVYYAVSILF